MKKNIKSLGDIFYYTLTSLSTILIFVIVHFLFGFDLFLSLIISMAIGAFFIYKQSVNEDSRSLKKLNRLSPEKEAFYKSKGMSKEEIKFFRETMHTAKLKLLRLEKNLHSVSKLEPAIRGVVEGFVEELMIMEAQLLFNLDNLDMYVELEDTDAFADEYMTEEGNGVYE